MPTLMNSIEKTPPAIYYGKRFRQMLEDHLTYILGMPGTRTEAIAEDKMVILNKYVGDWYGFLDAMGYPRQYHWVILRMNGSRDRLDLRLGITVLLVPDYTFIDKLAQLSKEKVK